MAKKMDPGQKAVKIMRETQEQMQAHERRFAPLILATPSKEPSGTDIVNEYIAADLERVMVEDIEAIREELRLRAQDWLANWLLWDLFRGIENEYYKRQDEAVFNLLKGYWLKAASLQEGGFFLKTDAPLASEFDLTPHPSAQGTIHHVSTHHRTITLEEADDAFWHFPVVNSAGEPLVELQTVEK